MWNTKNNFTENACLIFDQDFDSANVSKHILMIE